MNTIEERSRAVSACMDEHLRRHPELADRIYRQLLIALHTRGISTVDAIHDEARTRAGRESRPNLDDPNRAERDRLDELDRIWLHELIRELVCAHFTVEDVSDLVSTTVKREEVHLIEDLVTQRDVSFLALSQKLQQFASLPEAEGKIAPAEVLGTRVALVRHFISDDLEYIGVAKNHLRIRDFAELTQRMISTDKAVGKIGGKAGGMILAHRILKTTEDKAKAKTFLPIALPDSYFIRSDIIEEFMRINRLGEWQNQKYKPIQQVADEYPLIKGVFRNGDFPVAIVQSLRRILADVGTHPLIVRSSSLLEDRFGTAFSGKYASVFVANQGELESRIQALLGAIAEVYASTLAPDPIQYRREHNLIDYQEDMAVIIQKVVGVTYRHFLLPLFAGVGFSRNEYRWTSRIRREDGLMRLVMGLGTRAVDRVGSDYPRMVALGAPTLRPESNALDIMRYSQRTVDVINLDANRFEAVRLTDLLDPALPMPMLDKIVSIRREEGLYPPTSTLIEGDPSQLYITFEKLLGATPFAAQARDTLHRLEEAYGMPVDMEFASDGEKLYILQCRPLSQAEQEQAVAIPKDIPPDRIIFTAHKYVRSGLIDGMEYLVYIDPLAYDRVPSRERRVAIGRVVGRLNHLLPRRKFILIGPGRWGSNDIRLGVPVKYADLNHARMLIEVARQKGGYVPEVSFGTHFFQDLVEARIDYLPLYPDADGVIFAESFLMHCPNSLRLLLPDDAELAEEVRVIDLRQSASGRTLTVAMNGDQDFAMAYLA
ncbi:MAG: hypothetical protein IT449_09400 [Phycisphaerales bacterium]|nr:hypothetical protein [Phycisphaerales bacterium]